MSVKYDTRDKTNLNQPKQQNIKIETKQKRTHFKNKDSLYAIF